MATDANLALQASVTKTATFTGSGVTIGSTPRRGLKARVIYSAASNASGSNTVVFSIDGSFDGGSTWVASIGSGLTTLTLSTTAQAGELFIPFELSQQTTANQCQIRLVETLSGAGTSPTITYQGDVQLTRP